MPNWKKIALSGSNPEFASLTVDGAIEASKFSGSFSGSYQGDGSALTGLSLPQVTTVTDTFTSTTSKSVTHNFGTKNVIVQVYDTNDAFMIPSSIVTTDTNSVDISFANQASGRVVVAKGGHLVSGSVDFDNLANTPTLLSSSAQITGFGFISQSSDGAISSSAQIVALGANIVSSSAQIATDISGSFVATSASFATTIGSLTSDYTELTNVPADIVSSSAQIGADISGSLSAAAIVALQANIVSSSTQFQTLSLTNTSTDDTVLLTTTEDSSTAGPVLTLKRNSSSPADADYLGQIKFKGENDADQEVVYAKVTGKIQDASDGSEDGIIEFANKKAGSNVITARLRSDSLQLLNGTNLSVDGQVSASSFIGDGSGLTGVGTPGAISASAQIAGLGAGILSGSQTLYSQSFSSATAVTASHGFGTKEVVVSVYDNNDNLFFPNNIKTATTSAVHLDFNTARTGRVVVSKGGHVVEVQPTASLATTASYVQTAVTASYVQTAVTASYIQTAVTASYVHSASIHGTVANATSASYAENAATSSRSVNKNTNSGSICFWQGSQSEYDALGSYDSSTVYFVV